MNFDDCSNRGCCYNKPNCTIYTVARTYWCHWRYSDLLVPLDLLGPAAETIAVGTTTTGTPGSAATVTDSGTAPDHVFDFVIPAGVTRIYRTYWCYWCYSDLLDLLVLLALLGPTGPTGATGVTPVLTIGTVTTGAPGTNATATITGTAPNFVLNLTIPAGPTGTTPVS